MFIIVNTMRGLSVALGMKLRGKCMFRYNFEKQRCYLE